jgi:hypothetical protein
VQNPKNRLSLLAAFFLLYGVGYLKKGARQQNANFNVKEIPNYKAQFLNNVEDLGFYITL